MLSTVKGVKVITHLGLLSLKVVPENLSHSLIIIKPSKKYLPEWDEDEWGFFLLFTHLRRSEGMLYLIDKISVSC
jgi:hypothetical protein